MLKKLLIISILLIISTTSAIGFSDNELNEIEYSRYGQIYNNESLGTRLNRLETDFFGMGQTGNINDRVMRLKQISANSNRAAIVNPYSDYVPERRNKLKNIMQNAAEIFSSGSMTGFTPSYTNYGYNEYQNYLYDFANNYGSYCPYHNRYYPNNVFNSYPNQQRYNHIPYAPRPINNSGYYQSYYSPPNVTAGTSVHIIRD